MHPIIPIVRSPFCAHSWHSWENYLSLFSRTPRCKRLRLVQYRGRWSLVRSAASLRDPHIRKNDRLLRVRAEFSAKKQTGCLRTRSFPSLFTTSLWCNAYWNRAGTGASRRISHRSSATKKIASNIGNASALFPTISRIFKDFISMISIVYERKNHNILTIKMQ